MMEPEDDMRLDKWLWSVRVYKTRRLAIDACRSGRVSLNGQVAKPSRSVQRGDEIEARTRSFDRKLRVTGFPERRIGAKQVPDFLDDLTPQEEYDRGQKTAVEGVLGRERGSGRPTKHDRREIDRLLG
jgi:ribosome-associated heat shock protein Hsp15